MAGMIALSKIKPRYPPGSSIDGDAAQVSETMVVKKSMRQKLMLVAKDYNFILTPMWCISVSDAYR